VAAYATARGLKAEISSELWQALTEDGGDRVIVEYTLTEADVQGPFIERLPTKMDDMKDLPSLGYTGPAEQLAERFHMSPELFRMLNGDDSRLQAGNAVFVTNVSSPALPAKVARIEVNKDRQTLTAFGQTGDTLAVYPVTVGSNEKPAPDGSLRVTKVTKNPTYHYNPAYAFKGVKSSKPFTIKPGPNNPVGVVWIGLNKQGYGIHGTPEPSKVSKAESHGCIRLTNWDALQLASATSKNVQVEFVNTQRSSPQANSTRRETR
jgi:lipoprotein-anchoring transpeptidase ErfK/SrfK